MVRQTRLMTARWRADAVLDVDLEMRRLTLSIAGRCLLGVDPGESTDEILEAIETLFSDISSVHRIAFPFPKLIDALPLPGRRRCRAAQKTVARTLAKWIREMSDDRRERRQDCLAAVAGTLPQQMPENDPRLTEAFDTLMTILVSGVQTTAEALTAIWYLLALHPEVESRLHAELDRVPAADDLDAAAISRLTLLNDIQREALRLYPPVPGLSRTPVEPVELGGHLFDESEPLGLIPLHMHRDERYYREAEAFRPCRWHRPEADSIPAGAYFPFGLGGRRCLGELFATLETSVVIATVAREWRLARAEDADLRLGLRTTLRPNFLARLDPRR